MVTIWSTVKLYIEIFWFLFSQELEFVKFAKKQKIQELTEAKKALKREVERLRIERDVKAHELVDERKLTKQQIDTALSSKMPNILKVSANILQNARIF